MNPIIISVIIGSTALIASIFASSYLNQRALENQGRMLEKLLDTKFDAFRSEMRSDFKELRAESSINFKELRGELKTIETRLDNVERRVGRIEDQLNLLFVPAVPRVKSGD